MFKNLYKILIVLLYVTYATSLNARYQNNDKIEAPSFLRDTSAWVDSVFKSLTFEEKLAQLIIAPAFPDKDSAHFSHLFDLVKTYKIGGIIFFHGELQKTAQLSNDLQALAKTPLFMSIDGEWGLAMRIDSTLVYPKQIMLGAIGNDSLIYNMACDISCQLKRMGFQTNFSPVVDVNNNPNNPVINSRSFGENNNNVLSKGYAYMSGLQDNHIISFAKHFPGHGDTEVDSHLSLPIIPYTISRLDSVELKPFKYLINKGVSGIMVGHLDVPAYDTTCIPSTISSKIIGGLLRDSFKFKGLVITDALNMKGITAWGYPAQIAIQSLKAGNDILLMPDEIPQVIAAIKCAVDSGLISRNEIDNKCRKMLLMKYWVGLNHYKPISLNHLYEDLNQTKYELTRRKLIESAFTVIKNDNNILPIQNLDTLKTACVIVGSMDTSLFQETLNLYAPIDNFFIDRDAPDSIYNCLLNKLRNYNLVIAGVVNTDMRASKKFGITDTSILFLKKLADSTNVILDLFANPYALQRFVPTNKFKAIIVSYEDKLLNQDLSAQLIFGGITPQGKLPVKASDEYFANTGLIWKSKIRLKYTIPEELNINSQELLPIDSLVNEAIQKKALPGCIIYLAKDGKVFYNKAFGYFTYDSIRKVKTSDVYDLASITKIAATVPSLMFLYDRKMIDLNGRLSKYLPDLKKSNKKKIILRDILTHQSGLKSWYPFYIKTIQCIDPKEKLISKVPASVCSYKVDDGNYINCNTEYLKNTFSKTYSSEYKFHVADSLYLNSNWRDSIFNYINTSDLYPQPSYHYSDIGFMMLSEAIVNTTKVSFDNFLDSIFYKPLGANTLCFNPLTKLDKQVIAPTENDRVFRKQIVLGYVHDPTAAMLGGISGHAGLFANANDLGKLMQMYLNKGTYGGKCYIDKKTIELFTSRPFSKTGNRRALGFDKPEPDLKKDSPVSRVVSDSSYGHTGFTGTMTWVDPQNNLVYIFLSNRVYPDANPNKLAEINLRTNIQEVVYKAIQKGMKK